MRASSVGLAILYPLRCRIGNTAPSRTGSLIVTVYGDAILPRGGALALTDLLTLMRRMGAADGVVRTAVSRLARDGLLQGSKSGRHSAYALTRLGETEFRAAVPRIYGPADQPWDGRLRLAFPESGDERTIWEQAGFAALAPAVLLGIADAAPGMVLVAEGPSDAMRALAARAWPLIPLAQLYGRFLDVFAPLCGTMAPTALDAMAARIALIHAWRRIALRDPHLPSALLPNEWPGHEARALCIACYAAVAESAEAWLDKAATGSGPMPSGPDPMLRFSGGDTPHAAPAWSPVPAGSRRPPRSAAP